MAPKTKPGRADVCIIGVGASGATAAKVLTEHGPRVVALERQQKELRSAIALLVFKSNAFETQLPLTPEQKQQIKSLEDQITVARYLDTIFPLSPSLKQERLPIRSFHLKLVSCLLVHMQTSS